MKERKKTEKQSGDKVESAHQVVDELDEVLSIPSLADDALRISEKRYQLLFENAPMGILSVNRGGEILEANKSLLGILGSPSVEATKRIDFLSFPPIVKAGVSDAVKHCFETGLSFSAETPYESKWGRSILIHYRVTPVFINTDHVISVQITVEDITERMRVEKEIKLRNYELATVNEISNILNQPLELALSLKAVLEQISKIANADGVECHLPDADGYLTLTATWGLDKTFSVASREYCFRRDEGIPGQTFTRRNPVIVRDAMSDERYWRRDLARDAGYHSLLCVPIIGLDSLLGTFTLYSREKCEYSIPLQKLMMAIGGQLATAIERAHLFEALRESEKKFKDLFEKSGDAILIIENGEFVDCNQATVKMLRYESKRDFINAHPSALSPELQPDGEMSLGKADRMMKIAIKKGSHRFVWEHLRADGEVFPVEVLLTTIRDDDAHQVLHTIWRDITERVEAERKLSESETLFRAITEQSGEGISLANIDGDYVTVNLAFCEMTGYSKTELLTMNVRDLVPLETEIRLFPNIVKNEVGHRETELIMKDGSHFLAEIRGYPIQLDDRRLVLGTLRDITKRKQSENRLKEANEQLRSQLAEIKKLEVALREQAIRDPLTGLYNRRYMDEVIRQELAKAARKNEIMSIVILDLDGLKEINDTYGHVTGGDAALKTLASMLSQLCRTGDTLCRYAGDEFLVIFPSTQAQVAYERTMQWKKAVAEIEIRSNNKNFGITFSAGVAAYPTHTSTGDELIQYADRALYRAKALGRNQVVVFNDGVEK